MKTGIGFGAGAIIVLVVHLWNGGSASELVQPAALLFVMLGTLLSTYVSGGPDDFRRALRAPVDADEKSRIALKKELGDLASVARKEGFLALDGLKLTASRSSVKDGIQYLVSGFDQAAIRDLFDAGLERKEREAEASVRLWEIAAQAAPSVGALGATLGLLSALSRLDDPAQLGKGIASAMAAVLYGFFLSNFVFAPIAARKRRSLGDRILPEEMVKSAILGIQEGTNPQVVEERLRRLSADEAKELP